VELTLYNGIPHLLTPVVDSVVELEVKYTDKTLLVNKARE
jgi:hypothetical protein